MARYKSRAKRRATMQTLIYEAPQLRLIIYARSGGRCFYCGALTALALGTMDHRVPIQRGGQTEVSNLVWACREDNIAKGHLSLAEYRAHVNAGTPFWGEQRR